MYSFSKIKCAILRLLVAFFVVTFILYRQSALESIVNLLKNDSSSLPEWRKVQLNNVSTTAASLIKSSFSSSDKPDGVLIVNASSWLAEWVLPTLNSKLVKSYPFLGDPIVNPHSFNYTLFPKNANCSGRGVEVAICVYSSRNNFDSRQTIRETWGNYSNVTGNQAVLVFFIGSELNNTKSETQRLIEEEAKVFGDILQESYIDNYKNLSLKTVSIFKWFTTYCPKSYYLLKADDDLYVNVPLLARTMKSLVQTSGKSVFVVGHEYLNNKPNRNKNDKFYTPLSMYKDDAYPRYILGGAYAMTALAAWLLYEASLRVPLFWIEDIFLTGLCALKAGVPLIHSNLFSYGTFDATGCAFQNHIAHHRYSIKEIRLIHSQLYDPNIVCRRA